MDLRVLDLVLRNSDYQTLQKSRGVCKAWENHINSNLKYYPKKYFDTISLHYAEENVGASCSNKQDSDPKPLDLEYLPFCHTNSLVLDMTTEEFDKFDLSKYFFNTVRTIVVSEKFNKEGCIRIGRQFKTLSGFREKNPTSITLKEVLSFLPTVSTIELDAFGAAAKLEDLMELADRMFLEFDKTLKCEFCLKNYKNQQLREEDLIAFIERLDIIRVKQRYHNIVNIVVHCPKCIDERHLYRRIRNLPNTCRHIILCKLRSGNRGKSPTNLDGTRTSYEDLIITLTYRCNPV